jgi:hypothetical protein
LVVFFLLAKAVGKAGVNRAQRERGPRMRCGKPRASCT